MTLRKPRLVISGLALVNPYVGQGVYSLRLLQGLARRMAEDFIVVAPATISRPPELSEANFRFIPPFLAPQPAQINHAVASHHLLAFVRKEFPHAIFHSPGPILGVRKPAKMIVTLHDCLYRHFPNYNGRFFVRKMFSRITERFAAGADLVLTDSKFSRNDLMMLAKIPPAKMAVLYPWVGQEFLEPLAKNDVEDLRERLRLPKDFWLYVGGFDFRKNIDFLIEAYAIAAERAHLPPLVLAGKIPSEKNVATCDVESSLRRNGLSESQVIQPGRIEARDLPILYRAASLFVFPSLGEGFGLPPAEAMAVGTPILSSNRMSLPEVISNSRCLFDPCDLNGLVEKLIAARRDGTQFLSPLPPMFTENYAIDRYLELIARFEHT